SPPTLGPRRFDLACTSAKLDYLGRSRCRQAPDRPLHQEIAMEPREYPVMEQERKRRSRPLVLLCCFLLVLLVAIYVAVFLQLGRSYDARSVRKIRPGMTEPEVEAIIGGSASSTTSPLELPPVCVKGTPKFWNADAGVIVVYFNPEGKVTLAQFFSWE